METLKTKTNELGGQKRSRGELPQNDDLINLKPSRDLILATKTRAQELPPDEDDLYEDMAKHAGKKFIPRGLMTAAQIEAKEKKIVCAV